MSDYKKKNLYLIKNILIFFVGTIGTKLINFALVPVYTNVLSPAEYGVIDLIFTFICLTSPLVMLDMWEGILRFSLDPDADHEKLLSISAVAFLLGLALSFLLVPPVCRLSLFASLAPYSGETALYLFVYSGNLMIVSHLRGQEKLGKYTFCTLLTTFLIALFNIIFLVMRHEGIRGYLKANILAYSITGIIGFFLGQQYRVLFRFKMDWALFKRVTCFSLAFLPNILALWVINSSDRVMIVHFLGEAADGLYAASSKLPTIVSTIGGCFMNAWAFSAVREAEDASGEYGNYIYSRLVAVESMLTAFLLLTLKPVMRVYVAEAFYEAWRYSPCLILGSMFCCLGNFLAMAYFANKDNKATSISALFGAGLNIVLNLLLIPRIGVQGAALATLISYIAIFFYRAVDTRRYQKIRHNDRERLITVGLVFVMAVLVFVDSVLCQAALVVLFAAVLFLNRRYFREIISLVAGMLRRKHA